MIKRVLTGMYIIVGLTSAISMLTGCSRQEPVPESEKVTSTITSEPTAAAQREMMHQRNRKGP